ncbi:MAG: hypothetical protein H9W81_12530 [Enterococcus sp.]|nr:hypothetical protein [Enterococcus sp.]
MATIDDILAVKDDLDRRELEHLRSRHGDPYEKITEEYIHLGNMVASLIDSRVPELDKRLREIQTLVVDYHEAEKSGVINDDPLYDIERKVTEKSLSLGYDLQQNTLSVLAELDITGEKIRKSKVKGDKHLRKMFIDNSQHFPQQWNSAVRSGKRISFAKEGESSSYEIDYSVSRFRKPIAKLEIAKGSDGVYSFPNLQKSLEAEMNNPLDFYSKHEIIHEMTHMYEKGNSTIGTITANFLKARVTDKNGKRYTYRDFPNVYVDSFPNIFTGKSYNRDFTHNEIMARGTESVLAGANGSLIGLPSTNSMRREEELSIINIVPDIEHRNLVLGILAGMELKESV